MHRLLGVLMAIAIGIAGSTAMVVYRAAAERHDLAVDLCQRAGGGWRPRSRLSFAGTCLAHPADAGQDLRDSP